MAAGISESEFNMWRAIFAAAHIDEIVTSEEKQFLYNIINTSGFSDVQKALLEDDMETAKDVTKLFGEITAQDDRTRFFHFARLLMWSDGDFGAAEQALLTKLAKTHYKNIDFDQLMASVDLQLEEDKKAFGLEGVKGPQVRLKLVERFMKKYRG